MGRLTVRAVPVLTDNYVWLIGNPDSGEAIAVDPSVAQPVLDAVETDKLRLTQVLNTHWHPDHTGGNEAIKAATRCSITAPAEAQRVSAVDRIVAEGDRVTVAGSEAVIWDIPAHTAGHIAYYFEEERMIFVGDTMFSMGCGRLFEGTAEEMLGSLDRLAALPGDTRVFCGHEYTEANLRFAMAVEPANSAIMDYVKRTAGQRAQGRPTLPSTIELEKRVNPFLRCRHEDVKSAAERRAGRMLSTPVAVFAEIRSWKDTFR